jgi:hypothetical protein
VPRLDWRLTARLLLALTLLVAISRYAGTRIVEGLIPVYRAEIELVQDTYRIRVLELATVGADRVVRIEAGIARMTAVAGKVLDDDPRNVIRVSTLAANAYLPGLLGLGLMLAWPVPRGRLFGIRLLVGLPLLALVVLLDVPLLLLGGIHESLLLAAGAREFSPLVAWQAFMQAGGRYALAIAAGAMALMATSVEGEQNDSAPPA